MPEERQLTEGKSAGTRPAAPSPWVARHLVGVPPGGRILDVACGSGRHLRLALAKGHHVTGIDRDLAGVADLGADPHTELIRADLETGGEPPFRRRSFAGVVVTNYLWRPLLPAIMAAVAPDGVLVYETFGRGNERYGRPSNPAFLLEPGELIEAVRPHLVTIAYEHVTLADPARIVQRIVAVGPEHRWISDPPPASCA